MKAKFLGLAIFASGCVAALPAYAHGLPQTRRGGEQRMFYQDPPPAAAPEIDPAMATSALTLLAGGLAVLRGRRRKD